MSHPSGFYPPPRNAGPARWPGLPARLVTVGGVSVTFDRAERDLGVLARSGGVAVRQVLAAAGSPLAGCDYLSALAPFREAPPVAGGQHGSGQHGRGAAGRPAARLAFMRAIRAALAAAELAEPGRVFAAELGTARDAFGSDAAYAADMAAAAVQVLSRRHDARLASLLSAAVRTAASACAARPGEFACAAVSACGTGDCRLARSSAGAPLAGEAMTVPAGPGRLPRPANHARAGQGFSAAAALAALAAAVPFDAAAAAGTARPSGADFAVARDAVPGSAVLVTAVLVTAV